MATSTKRQHKILDLASRLHDKSDKGRQRGKSNNTKIHNDKSNEALTIHTIDLEKQIRTKKTNNFTKE